MRAFAAVLGALAALAVLAAPPGARAEERAPESSFRSHPFALRACDHPIAFRRSFAGGAPWHGFLARGVRLPRWGCDHFSWHPARRRTPNSMGRLWGTDYLLRKLLRVLKRFREAHPEAPRVGIGDISRRRGGIFDERFGGLGHHSHQNGLDVDVYYPRTDRLERAPRRPRQVDRRLAQDLVRRFVRANAKFVFVGLRLRLRGPRRIVQRIGHHEDHMHVRIYARRRSR